MINQQTRAASDRNLVQTYGFERVCINSMGQFGDHCHSTILGVIPIQERGIYIFLFIYLMSLSDVL